MPTEDEAMSGLMVNTTEGTRTQIDQSAIDALAKGVQGRVLTPGADGYDAARTIWNAMVDRRPGLIVQCSCAEDIVAGVTFAKAHGLLLAVKGGGHNIGGFAVCDGGMMLDLSPMKSVEVDPQSRTATVQPGATLAEVDAATQAHALALPVGINSTTGIAGLTLGGGFGWTSRKFGLTIDNLLSADVVTAEGGTVHASTLENPDLYWGLRGGGGNFGVVSSFKFALHPLGPEVLSGLVVHPFDEALGLLRFYRDFAETLPDDVSVWVVMRKAPPLPFLPQEWHFKNVLIFAAMCTGDMANGEQALEPLRRHGSPIVDVIGPHSFVGWQQAFDPLLTPGMRNYWKSCDFTALPDGLLETLVGAAGSMPGPHFEIFLGQLGGAISRVPASETAYRDRSLRYMMNVHGRWDAASDDVANTAWSRQLYEAAAPFSTGGGYVNFMTEEESGRIQSIYGDSYQRLVDLKRKYDPMNLFRLNQNIKP